MKFVRALATVLLFAVLFAGLTASISAIQNRMNTIREVELLTETTPLQNAPPLVAFTTIALGGFRGLVADWLWLRSHKMEQQGNLFEMVQLASWIVKLQPRFTGATAFLAWNMAYNISVTFNEFEDRWRWVRRGIELIRDEALDYNPGDPNLFRELAWMFQNKLGMGLDEANRYYKTEMAWEMVRIMGGGSIDWQLLVDAPKTEAELKDILGRDAQVWSILSAHGIDLKGLESQFRAVGNFDDKLREELTEAGAADVVEHYLRRRWLLDKHMEPERMVALREKYGDLDFRLPESHALYWATRGLEAWVEGDSDFKKLACKRMIFQALSNAFRGGKLVYLKDIEHLEWTPNVGIVDAVDASYLAVLDEQENEVTALGGYESFLVDAIVTLYTFGKRTKAEEYLKKGKERYAPERWRGDLDEYAVAQISGDLELMSYDKGQGIIQAYLLQAYHALAVGDDERAVSCEAIASRIWRKYQKDVKGTEERRGLPPYLQMKREVREKVLEAFKPGLGKSLKEKLPEAESLRPEAGEDDDGGGAGAAAGPKPGPAAPKSP